MKIIYLFIIGIFLFSTLHSQVISGRVISARNNVPLEGVTLQVKGQRQTVITTVEGKFSITASGENILVISHSGYRSQEIPLNKLPSPLIILLEETVLTLQEVTISNGYQDIPKERSTGSFSVIDNQLYNQQKGTNILDRLEGITPSLSVDRKSNSGGIMIRGLSTIKGVRGPLIIVDNFPYSGDINNINPNDVESITVLKDAAAASIWGSKAGNGVIVITTKKGKYNQKVSVEAGTNVTVTQVPDLFYMKPISTTDFIDVEQFLFSKGYKFSDTSSSSKPAFSPVYEILFKQRKGLISAADASAQIDALRGLDVRNEFLKYFYQKGINQQYSLSIKGGSANIAWILSAGADRNRNTLGAGYNRYNTRLENMFRVSNKLQLSAGIAFTQSNSETGKPAFGNVTAKSGSLYPYARFADANGNAITMTKELRQSYVDTAGAGKLLDWKYYPLEDYKNVKNTNCINDILLKTGLNYKIITGVQLDIKYQYERQIQEGHVLQDIGSYFARDLINRFSQLNRTTGVVTYKVPKGGILDITNTNITSHNFRGQINLNRTWGDHAVTALAGGEISSVSTTGSLSRTFGYNPEILTDVNVDLATTFPSFVTGSSSLIPANNGFSKKLNRVVSFYSNAAYTFREKYSFTASARRDASNIFGINTNNRWSPLWSAGLGWDFSKESFYKISFLPFGKLRATYGYSGNIDPSMTALTTLLYQSTSPYTLTPIAVVNNFYNPDLRWEKVRTMNLAVDFRSEGNRITGSIDVYQKKATDLFGSSPIDYTSGLNLAAITRNVATMKAQGLDIDLNAILIDKAIKWTTNCNLSLYKDKVITYYSANKAGSNYINYGEGLTAVEGRPVYSVFSYRWGGLDPQNGDPQGFINGVMSKDYSMLTGASTLFSDLVYHGPQFPTVFGSIGNTLSWKGISVSARLLYRFGYFFRKQSISYTNLYASWLGHADYANRWKQPGDELVTNVPSMVYPSVGPRDSYYLGSAVNVAKADNIRLQYINFSYGVKKMKAFFILNNVGILWRANKDHLDPDYRSTEIPNPSSFTLGLNASF